MYDIRDQLFISKLQICEQISYFVIQLLTWFLQLANARHDFLIQNGYSQCYIDLINTKAISDNEADENSKHENGKLVYWIRCCPEQSTKIEEFIWLLEKK